MTSPFTSSDDVKFFILTFARASFRGHLSTILDMDSDDEIAVARPGKMANGYSTSAVAPVPRAADEGANARSSQVSEQTPANGVGQKAGQQAAADTAVVDLLSSSSRAASPSPLSEVDEDVLEVPPTTQLQELAFDKAPAPSRPTSSANKPSDPTDASAVASRSPAQPLQTAAASKPKRNLRFVNMYTPDDPPTTKRRRGRLSRMSVSEITASQNDDRLGTPDELAFDHTEDDLDVRPTSKAFLGGRVSKSAANKLSARTRGQRAAAGELPGSSRLRETAVEEEKYEPLRLREGSNWVLFDPVKSFPSALPSPPSFLKCYARYKPGNRRILEYNLMSNSVRWRSTPKALKGKLVSYGSNGPQIK